MLRRYTLLPPVVQILLILNGGMFLLEMYTGDLLIQALALWPYNLSGVVIIGAGPPDFHLWQLVTYSFLHGSVMHLLLNMYALWLFGSRMENVWGSRSFTLYYFFCVIGAALTQLIAVNQDAPTVGASGGVFGVLLAFGLTFPNEKLMLIFPPIVLRAKWFVLIFGVIELWAGVTGSEAGVAHFAHLGGMLFGFLLLLYWWRHPSGFR